MTEKWQLLFVCTGNIYRSRFAEALFNHHACLQGIPAEAFSRGLKPEATPVEGLSPHTAEALRERGISLRHTALLKRKLEVGDLERAHRVVVLSEEEHRPMIREQFPAWEDRVMFWEVADVQFIQPVEALSLIENQVVEFLRRGESIFLV